MSIEILKKAFILQILCFVYAFTSKVHFLVLEDDYEVEWKRTLEEDFPI